MNGFTTVWKVLVVAAIALGLTAGGLSIVASNAASEQAIARGANTKIFFDQGGARLNVGNGGMIDVQSGGVIRGASLTGTFVISGQQQYPQYYFEFDGVNGAMVAHGMPGAPTYPHCDLYTPVWVSATVYISSANATSATLAMVLADGTPYTGSPLAVRCSATYVPQ